MGTLSVQYKIRKKPDIRRGLSAACPAVFPVAFPVVFLAACIACAVPARAQEKEPAFLDLSPEQLLGAQVITATKEKEPVAKTPAAVYVITQEDIRRTGVTSLPDALRMAPGVDVAQGTANSWTISIRGFNKGLADQLLVMIDGRTVYNPLFAGTYWELQNLPMEDIDRIEVVRGPGGSLWGANAVNGIINIITKSAQDTQGNLGVARLGTNSDVYGLAQHGGRTKGGGYYRVYAQHLNDGGFDTPSGGKANDAWHDSRAGFRYDKGDALTVQGDAYVNTTDKLTALPQPTAPYSSTFADDFQSSGANLLAHWRRHYDDGGMFSVRSYLDYTRRSQLLLDDMEELFDVDAQYNLPKQGRNAFIVGGGYRLSHENIGNTPTAAINPPNRFFNLFNAFAQDKITLSPDRWYLTLGAKVEHNDYTGFEVEPNARLQWFPDDRQSVWAAVSRAVRTPSPLERDINLIAGYFPGPIAYNLSANPGLQAENLIAYELGYRNQITPDFSIDTAAFANDYSGLAAQQFVSFAGGVFKTQQANLMSAETYGFEVASDWQARPDWKLSAGYSFLQMYLHLPNDFTNLQAEERQSPTSQANLRSYWDINDSWTLDTSLYYVSGLGAYKVPGYVRLDMNLGWHVRPGVRFNFVGQNLFDPGHRETGTATDLNATEIPQAVFGKLTWEF